MKILYIADGRSPIALNWIGYFCDYGHEVHLASIYPCTPQLNLASVHIIPVTFSVFEASGKEQTPGQENKALQPGWARRLVSKLATPGLRTSVRHWFVPLFLPKAAEQLRALIAVVQPDLVHAMRIPYEGMLAAIALNENQAPLIVSVWGNDFTLHAAATPLMVSYTRQTLRRATALHADCQRDLHLAYRWGFGQKKPARVLPGAGGIQSAIFYPATAVEMTEEIPTVINPRGLRAYVRNDTFFKAIPLVLSQRADVRFLCPAMAGERQAEEWVKRLGIGQAVNLLPHQNRRQMADLFRQSQVAVSITEHDGTPNTLLEAMACGCFPIVGNLESIREWIVSGENGFLVNPRDSSQVAQAILEVLDNKTMRNRAREYNHTLILERADYDKVMETASAFYNELYPNQIISQ
jgi:glycosyltransferase involved in cell wall biosynthesis